MDSPQEVLQWWLINTVYHLRKIRGEGGGGGLLQSNFLQMKKGGGHLEEGVIWEGGFVKDLRHANCVSWIAMELDKLLVISKITALHKKMPPIPSHAIHFNLLHVCPSVPPIIFAVLFTPSFLDMSSSFVFHSVCWWWHSSFNIEH